MSTLSHVPGYDFSGLSLEKQTIGIIMVCVGAYLLLFGKKYFKVFLGMIGFVAFAAAALYGLVHLNAALGDFGSNTKTIYFVVIGIVGILGAAVAVTAWRMGIYACAASGGFFLGTLFLGFAAKTFPSLTRQVFLALCSAAAVVLVTFFDELVVQAASSVIGALLLMVGIDCFTEQGLIELVLNIIQERNLKAVSPGMYGLLAATAGVAFLGFAFQLMFGTRGFGRKE